ncbi:MAG: hypothetical protein RI981_600 [Bacteroidota bacterium]|jgi:hypothetical protein
MIRIQTLFIFFTLLYTLEIKAQENSVITGLISYISKNEIYVRFPTTQDLIIGDTLSVWDNQNWQKALVIESLSSQSCKARNFSSIKLDIGAKIHFTPKITTTINKKNDYALVPYLDVAKKEEKKSIVNTKIQQIDARISVSTNGSRVKNARDFDRFRTTASLDIHHIQDSRLSLESYITFNHKLGTPINDSTFRNDFKIYALALSYASEKGVIISLGRKLNNRLANMGAIDGLQVEKSFRKFTWGTFAGTRPDVQDYSFNKELTQFGGFLAHESETTNGPIQTSLAFAEQKFKSATDRRFIYFQHSNAYLKNLQLFYSVECDLFQHVDSVQTNRWDLTSMYLSLRYKASNKLSFTTSYDNRKNIIYYESYRNFLDQLLNQETRQGFRMQMNYRVHPLAYLSLSGFYRYQSNRPDPTKNYVANLSISQIPKLQASVNLNFNYMDTYYFSGTIWGASVNKDLFKGFLSTEFSYRKVDYLFVNKEQGTLNQHIWGASVNMYGKKRTSLMLSYEGTIEPTIQYGRYYLTLTQRFRTKKPKKT